MSGTDLPGVSPLTRTDAGVRTTLATENGPTSRAVAAELAGSHREAGRQPWGYTGLPSNVIHELRTPLTSIHGYAQVLQRSLRDDARATNALSVVVRESTRLSAMLASLSELAELEAGDIVATQMPVEVEQIVDGVVHEASRRDAGAHPIRVDGAAIACCNPTLLSQALLHVLTNATRFSPDGSEITVAIAQNGPTAEIVVTNPGSAIDPADDERIYEPFQRGANARQASVRGLGLGLFLAREALRHVGGTISHRARSDGSIAFRIVLPAV